MLFSLNFKLENSKYLDHNAVTLIDKYRIFSIIGRASTHFKFAEILRPLLKSKH